MSYTIEINQDLDGYSPRNDDNLTTLLLSHPRYNLPWETSGRPASSLDELYQVAQDLQPVLILKVYMLDHSGLALAAGDSDPFSHLYYGMDSGMVGLVVVTRQAVKDLMGWTRVSKQRLEKLERYAKAEVATYSQYINGEVYWYVIEDDETGEVMDSCGGYYGWDACQEAAQEALDGLLCG